MIYLNEWLEHSQTSVKVE